MKSSTQQTPKPSESVSSSSDPLKSQLTPHSRQSSAATDPQPVVVQPQHGQTKTPQIISSNRPSNQSQMQSAAAKRFPNSISIPHARALFDFSAKENG